MMDLRELTIEKASFFKKAVILTNMFLQFINNEISNSYNFAVTNLINAETYSNGKSPIAISVVLDTTDNHYADKPIWVNQKAWIEISSTGNNKGELFYEKVKELVESPIGHRNVFEVKNCDQLMKVVPFKEQGKIIKYGSKQKVVVCNSVGYSSRKLIFSKNNICHRKFLLRYGTTAKGGGIIPRESPQGRNVASSEKKSRYLKDAKEYVFEFVPRERDDNIYSLEIDIYKGMDLPKGTNVHYHLYKGLAYYREFNFQLDLSQYVKDDYTITHGPFMYLINEDLHSCNETYKDRIKENIIDPSDYNDLQGIWKWNLKNQRAGVLDIIWGITRNDMLFQPNDNSSEITTIEFGDVQQRIIDKMCRCPTLGKHSNREEFIRDLPFGIHVKVFGSSYLDVRSIVQTCNEDRSNYKDLVEVLSLYEGDHYLVNEIRALVTEIN